MKAAIAENPSAEITLPLTGEDFPLHLVRLLTEAGKGAFDAVLARALLGSLSLDFAEKAKVIGTRLSMSQRQRLLKIFSEESTEFTGLFHQHPTDIMELTARQVFTAFILGRHYGPGLAAAMEDAMARRMARRALRRGIAPWLEQTPDRFWQRKRLFTWFWRHALPVDHPAWGYMPLGSDPESLMI